MKPTVLNFVQETGMVLTFDIIKIKVKCILVQALRLCTGRTAHTGVEV
jgi:hypothetical protein